jgi:S-adenosylmethionine:tRNA ribosyltransferase-isomerase
MIDDNLRLDNYDYILNKESIANYPCEKRDESKLLVYKNKKIRSSKFLNISSHIPDNSTIFLNDSRVINSRFFFLNSNNKSIEILVTRVIKIDENKEKTIEVDSLIGNAKKWREDEILISKKNKITLKAYKKDHRVYFSWNQDIRWEKILDTFGSIPLPPYIKREIEDKDYISYQTVYSKVKGSIASPTAGLHFSNSLINDLKKNHTVDTITLHVGIGTFKPINSEKVKNHMMHSENITISKKNIKNLSKSKNIIAVGTTSLRTLESLYYLSIKIINDEDISFIEQDSYLNYNSEIGRKEACNAVLNYMAERKINKINFKSSLFILPGYKFRFCDQLITNFHYPKSTLILLVAAFIGEEWRKIYNFASENNYRFLSYGDSSILYRK